MVTERFLQEGRFMFNKEFRNVSKKGGFTRNELRKFRGSLNIT